MSEQPTLWFDDLHDALKTAIQHLGGTKRIAHTLRPELSPDKAQVWLSNCLNPQRDERLSLDQVLAILRMARENDYHRAFEWLASECGYEAKPVTVEVHRDRLASAIENATFALQQALRAAEQLPSLRVAK